MQIFGGIDYVEALWKSSRRSLRKTQIFQPKHAEDSKTIVESTEDHLRLFTNQILNVEETKMAHLKEGLIPRKLNQWLEKATELKCQVTDALQKQQNCNDSSLECTELKEMCDKIFDHVLDCPIKDGNDKPMAFIAQMHETEDGNLACSILLRGEDGQQALDMEKVLPYSDTEGKQKIIIRSPSGIISYLESYFGIPRILSSESDKMGDGTVEGESSQVHDDVILDSSSPYISELSVRRYEKNHIHDADSDNNALAYPTSENIPPRLQADKSSSCSEESKHHMADLVLLTGVISKYADLRLQILSMSPIHATFNLNNDFGLHPQMDSYLFSAMKKPAELQPDSQRTLMANSASLLPETLIVNRRGPIDMLADEEWCLAWVVNLMEKDIRELTEEPCCINLEILFLQRNSRLTHICSSFFNQMPSLRFLDLSDTRIKALPSSLFELTNLQVLLLRNCLCLDSLPPEIKNLINMEALDLLGTELSPLPKEIGELTKLRYLQLSFYQPGSQSELLQLGAVFKLQVLQGLSIVVHPEDQGWINIVEDIIKQVGELKMLRYLQFYFPSVKALTSFSEVSLSWREHRLKSFKFLVGHNIKRIISRVPDEVESKYGEYDRCLRYVNGIEVPEMMKSVLERVTAFYLDHHLEIESLSDFDISILKELRFCVLRECPNIHVMIKREKRTESDFPNLEYLGLHYLWKLDQIWEDPIPPGSYQSLKYLMVSTCCKLEFIASHAVLQCLSNLERFIIEDCESLKSIVKENEREKYDIPLLPRLKELVLRHLPQLVVLGRGLFPSKQIISIHLCPELILDPVLNRIEWKKLLRLPYMNAAT